MCIGGGRKNGRRDVTNAQDDLGIALVQRAEGQDVVFVSRAEAEQLAKQKADTSVAFVSHLEVLKEIAAGAVYIYGKPLRIRSAQSE